MTLYPAALDSDTELPRVDDDLNDFEAKNINVLRDAIFAIQKTLGINPQGSLNSLAERLNIFFGANGKPKSSAMEELGLAPLPIQDKHIANAAGIKESKLNLYHSTSDLYTAIQSNISYISSILESQNKLITDLSLHILGSVYLSDGQVNARHFSTQIDMASKLFDFLNQNLDATTVDIALQKINQNLNNHQNAELNSHQASSISVDTDNFISISTERNNVQKIIEYFDQNEVLVMGTHRASQHAAAIPEIQRTQDFNSDLNLGKNIIPWTQAQTYLVHSPYSSPVDNLSIGDDIIRFTTNNDNYLFDNQFSQIKSGDVVTINYSNGVQSQFLVDSIRFSPGTEWIIRLNGVNLYDVSDALVRVDRPTYDINTQGILALAPVNIYNSSGQVYTDILTSLIISDPKAACTAGLGFDPGQLNSTHYKLYLEFYPSGKPDEKKISLPYIDVTGNAGATPGKYTLESVVQTVNNQFRKFGYNYRFMAFEHRGEFAISTIDSINNASFSIIKGINTAGILEVGGYTENVIGGNDLDDFDALGFGMNGSNIASPAYQKNWNNSTAALQVTKVISPRKKRFFYVDGIQKDNFKNTYLADENGFWDGYIINRSPLGVSNVEVTYAVNLDLRSAGLKPGKTIVVLPSVNFSDSKYYDVDYGRFVIKNVDFENCSGQFSDKTLITVVNGLHALGQDYGFSSSPDLPVKLHFSYDSVGFNDQNIVDSSNNSNSYSRWYEIYINSIGETFSHERLRFLKQSETGTLLASNNWHVIRVSPKLRGYQGSNPLIFNKYLRFFVKNYDSSTGEYDGYIGKISGTSIVNSGPVIHGKKNIPTKFYDETNVDYVELLFQDDSASPGTNIASSSVGRYIDLEIFPSLQDQDQLYLLGSCEVTWPPLAGQDLINYIKDLREFGSIGLNHLTGSAKKYLASTNQYLHENGIIRGFDFDSISSVIDSGVISFKGGLALIAGQVISSNNSSITLPRIYPQGSALPQTVKWMICVNQFGNLIPILLTDNKQQYFATTGSQNYSLPCSTFTELLFFKKDLVPIYLVETTVSSLNITSYSDFRKFVLKQDSHHVLTWSQDSEIFGHFSTLQAAKNWINYSNNTNQKIIIKGNISLSSSDSYFDLTGFSKQVCFDGSDAVFNISSSIGIKIGDYVTLENCTFNYLGSNISYTSNALSNCLDGNGCIVSSGDLQNISIKNCNFNCSANLQRPPFINLQLNKGSICKNIIIENNQFNDSGTTLVTQSQAAIAIWTNNGGGSSDPALIKNCKIFNNICNQIQGIYITTKKTNSVAESPGLNAINVNIFNNICGIIGFLTSAVTSSLSEASDIDQQNSITMEKNICYIIGNFYHEGLNKLDISDINYSLGNINILNNQLHWLFVNTLDLSASHQRTHIKISNNNFTSSDDDFITLFSMHNYALYVIKYSLESSNVLIDNNTFNFARFNSSTFGYDRAISCSSSAIICNNIIKGLNTSAIAINLGNADTSNKYYNVHNNQIYRGSNLIDSYIKVPNSGTSNFGIITDNFFDYPTIDDSLQTVIDGNLNQFITERNVNQTLTFAASASNGRWGAGTSGPMLFGDGSIVANNNAAGWAATQSTTFYSIIRYDSSIAGNDRYPLWTLDLTEIIPKNAYIVEVEAVLDVSTTFTTSDATISLYGTGLSTLTQDGGAPTSISTSGETLTITVPNKSYLVNNSIKPIVTLALKINIAATGGLLYVTSMKIKYRW